METVHLFVSGKVQGVGFRYNTQRKARELGVKGWVRNTADGRVEIEAFAEPPVMEKFLQWCGQGPSGAHVTAVEIVRRVAGAGTASAFEIRKD